MSSPDWMVVAVYTALIFSMGWFLRSRRQSAADKPDSHDHARQPHSRHLCQRRVLCHGAQGEPECRAREDEMEHPHQRQGGDQYEHLIRLDQDSGSRLMTFARAIACE